MKYRNLVPVLALLGWSVPAMAQEMGGLRLSAAAGTGPVGLARPLPAARLPQGAVQNGMTPADHQAKNQAMISALRGDPGFLSGFSFGTPLAFSRQPWPSDGGQSFLTDGQPSPGGGWYWRHHGYGEGGGQGAGQGRRPGRGHGDIIINNDGPLAVTTGNGNLVQQQSASGAGPIALQQVATPGGGGSSFGGGNVNIASGSRTPRVPGGH